MSGDLIFLFHLCFCCCQSSLMLMCFFMLQTDHQLLKLKPLMFKLLIDKCLWKTNRTLVRQRTRKMSWFCQLSNISRKKFLLLLFCLYLVKCNNNNNTTIIITISKHHILKLMSESQTSSSRECIDSYISLFLFILSSKSVSQPRILFVYLIFVEYVVYLVTWYIELIFLTSKQLFYRKRPRECIRMIFKCEKHKNF